MYQFIEKTKLASAVKALRAVGKDHTDEELIKAEYVKHGGVLGVMPGAKTPKPDLPLDRLTKEEVAEVRELLKSIRAGKSAPKPNAAKSK